MASVTIRNLDDDVIAALKRRAKANDRSLEAELRAVLVREVCGYEPEEFLAGGPYAGLARHLSAVTA